MSWIVTIRSQAKADLRDAHDWYEEHSAGLGDEFLADLAEALLRLEANPDRFPLYYRGFRRVLARRLPYKIFFRIEGEHLIVFRILHGARKTTRANSARENRRQAVVNGEQSLSSLNRSAVRCSKGAGILQTPCSGASFFLFAVFGAPVSEVAYGRGTRILKNCVGTASSARGKG